MSATTKVTVPRNDFTSFRALLRVSALEVLAYRGQMLVWILTSTMPFIMLALFGAVAAEAPLGRYGEAELVAYFLATFIVRQLTSSWVSWQINAEIQDGTLAVRLLRPVHPLFAYAADNLAALPLRAVVSLPVAAILLSTSSARSLPEGPLSWILFSASVVGAWLISLFVSSSVGALAFFLESSGKVMDLWLAAYFVFSGYLIPVDLFPPRLRAALDYLPFRYQIGLPVELLTGAHGRAEALSLVGRQWVIVAILGALMLAPSGGGLGSRASPRTGAR